MCFKLSMKEGAFIMRKEYLKQAEKILKDLNIKVKTISSKQEMIESSHFIGTLPPSKKS